MFSGPIDPNDKVGIATLLQLLKTNPNAKLAILGDVSLLPPVLQKAFEDAKAGKPIDTQGYELDKLLKDEKEQQQSPAPTKGNVTDFLDTFNKTLNSSTNQKDNFGPSPLLGAITNKKLMDDITADKNMINEMQAIATKYNKNLQETISSLIGCLVNRETEKRNNSHTMDEAAAFVSKLLGVNIPTSADPLAGIKEMASLAKEGAEISIDMKKSGYDSYERLVVLGTALSLALREIK